MSKKPSKSKKLYTLPLDYAHEVMYECDEQIDMSNDLLSHVYDEGLENPQNTHILPYIVEILWLNYSIKEILAREIEDPIFYEEEEDGVKEYIILEETIYQLQALLLSRFHSNLSLTRVSYSVSLH